MSTLDGPEGVESLATWRCPRCHTVQARTTRCWRCSQAAFTCVTCHDYQPSLADGLGQCARDPDGSLVSAADSRSCWESHTVAMQADPVTAPGGLFVESGPGSEPQPGPQPEPTTLRSVRTVRPMRSAPDRATRIPTAPRPRRSRPGLEDPGRAAWVEPEEDRLVDAPAIEPAKRLTTEVQRRRRRWFR
jgi:hypothetical protein